MKTIFKLLIINPLILFVISSFLKQSSGDEDQELLDYYQSQIKKGESYNKSSEEDFDTMKFISIDSENKPIPESFNSGFSIQGATSAYLISKIDKPLTSDRKTMVSSLKYHHTETPHFYKIPIQAELAFLTGKIAMGGHNAKRALERLHAIANHVNMDKYLKSFLPTALACKSLLMRQSEKWENRELCQSLYVRITNIPVTTQYADSENGVDYGMESSIVMPRPSRIYRPDREIEKLRAGANLNNILDNKALEY